MDDLLINLLIFAAIAIFSVIKQLRKGRDAPPPPPPRPRLPPRPAPAQNRALRPPEPEPEPERIDLSFLQDAFASLGIDLPQEAGDADFEDVEDFEVYADFDELEPTPPPVPEPALFVPRQPQVHAEYATVKDVAPFFADIDDYWDPATRTTRSGKAELFSDAVILGALLAPYKRH